MMTNEREITITRRQAGAIIRLLSSLETYLESVIDSHTVDGEPMKGDTESAELVAESRREWREAEDIVIALEQQIPKARVSIPVMKTVEEAYNMGRDRGAYGPNTRNCAYTLFATPELTAAWERGKADADAEKAQQRTGVGSLHRDAG